MSKRFVNKVAIVTGSSNGIGRATAVLFAEEGAKVTITGRNEKSLKETHDLLVAAGLGEDSILSVRGDLTDELIQKKLIQDTVDKFGKIDILVNNAGGSAPDMTTTKGFEQSIEIYDYVMNLNTRAVLLLTKLALHHLYSTQGEVVMISSIAGLHHAVPNHPYYAMSKAALDQLTRALAVEAIRKGVRVNSINPGIVSTTIMEKQGASANMCRNLEDMLVTNKNIVPAGHAATPRDIAESIAFLCDRRLSRYLVGHTLVVDGGASLLTPLSVNTTEANKVLVQNK